MKREFLMAIAFLVTFPLQAMAQDRGSPQATKNDAIKFIMEAYKSDNQIRTKGITSLERQPEATISFINNGCGVIFTYSERGRKILTDTIKNINNLNIYDEQLSISNVNDARGIVYECKGGRKCVEYWHIDLGTDARERAMNAASTISRNSRLISKIIDNFEIIQSACSR